MDLDLTDDGFCENTDSALTQDKDDTTHDGRTVRGALDPVLGQDRSKTLPKRMNVQTQIWRDD